MNLENQVVSLDLAKRLKELGVKQSSLFYWIKRKDSLSDQRIFGIMYINEFVNLDRVLSEQDSTLDEDYEYYSAFTVSELGEMLPGGICQTDKINKNSDPDLDTYAIFLAGTKYMFKDDKEANARAKMLIWLIENGYVKNEV